MDGLDVADSSFFCFYCLLFDRYDSLGEKKPGGSPRKGILGLDTTRGDRLFLSLLSAAYIHLGWLGLIGPMLWVATILSFIFAIFVFRYV